MSKVTKTLAVTLIKSLAKKTENHLANVRGLGLRRINHTVHVQDTPENRGMINCISYMVKVEQIK